MIPPKIPTKKTKILPTPTFPTPTFPTTNLPLPTKKSQKKKTTKKKKQAYTPLSPSSPTTKAPST